MGVRSTGWSMLASASVQEAMDFALIAHAATLESRVPFLHFFDGFRTSHEEAKIEVLADKDLQAMIDDNLVAAHRARALTPIGLCCAGRHRIPTCFFQAREACNRFYLACPDITQKVMDRFAKLVGRVIDYLNTTARPMRSALSSSWRPGANRRMRRWTT